MPPARSEASAAAASTVTRSGRVKPVSKAALLAVASEDHEAQQARRAGVTKKAARRAGTNRQGQSVASGTPKVVVSESSTTKRSTSRRQTSLTSLRVHKPISQQEPTSQSTGTRLQATALRESRSITRLATQASATRADSLDIFYTTAAAQPRSQSAMSITMGSGSGTGPSNTNSGTDRHGHRDRSARPMEVDGDNTDFPGAENEVEDEAGEGFYNRVEDEDDGASDDFIPSDIGELEDEDFEGAANTEEGDVVTQDRHGDGEDEDMAEAKPAKNGKPRATRNSKRTKKGQPKASDYSEDVEALLNYASGYMRALVVSEHPMPSVDESIEMAMESFEQAKHDRPTVKTPSDVKYISILRRAIAQVRGRIKDAARARAGDSYGFDDRPRMEQKNRRRYLALVEEDAYTYEKPDSLQGPYYHPLCYKILKTCFFSKASDDGVVFSDFFFPIRAETIALIFTAIRMCLDEWKSGRYKALTFTSDVYVPVYQVHLANLKALEEEDPLFVKGLGEELWEDCSEPFDLDKKKKPTVSITAEQKLNAILYAQERRNARAAQRATAAAANAAAAEELQME